MKHEMRDAAVAAMVRHMLEIRKERLRAAKKLKPDDDVVDDKFEA
jgi:hypothetical protein